MRVRPEDIVAVRRSWNAIGPRLHAVIAAFYTRLFEQAPALRAYFPEDLATQETKMRLTLQFVVDALDRPQAIEAMTRELGQLHAALGAQPAHYAPVGEALVETLEAELGPEFGSDARGAWRRVYAALADQMIDAAAHVPGTPANDPRPPS